MPIPKYAFVDLEELASRIIQPENSRSRITQSRILDFDRQAKEEGWPNDWRLSDEAREGSRLETLSNVLPRELWIFAYGSLIWDPGLFSNKVVRAKVLGWRRTFSLKILGGRATRSSPGLMAALEAGGSCEGVAYRIPEDLVEQETRVLWMREMIAGTYVPHILKARTDSGSIDVIAFTINEGHERYAGDLSFEEKVDIISFASGSAGTNFDYLENLDFFLTILGIDDIHIRELHAAVLERRQLG